MAPFSSQPWTFVSGSVDQLWQSDAFSGSAVRVALILIAAFFTAQTVYRIWFHPLSCFPGPWYLAISGVPTLFRIHIRGDGIRQIWHLHRKYGPAVRVGPNHLSFDGSIAWQDIYGYRSASKPEFSKRVIPFKSMDKILLYAPQDLHRKQRRQFAPGFSKRALPHQEPVVRRFANMLLDRLSERADGAPVDIVEWFNFVTFDTIGALAFSRPFHCLEQNGYHPWVEFMLNGCRGFGLVIFLTTFRGVCWVLVQLFARLNAVTKNQIVTYTNNVARERIEQGLDLTKEQPDIATYSLRKTRRGESGIDEGVLVQNASSLIVAGSETVATAMSGTFFHLLHNDKYKKLLEEEIRTSFATEEDITMRGTEQLPYLQACINESLRMYPPGAGGLARISPGGMVNDKFVPAGTQVGVSQLATFRNPANFLEPDTFWPQRWLPSTHSLYEERFAQDNLAVFKPFSIGPRSCIAQILAMSELRLILALCIYRLDFELSFDQSQWQDSQTIFGFWSKGPLMVNVGQRQKVGA